MSISREEIFEKIKEVLIDALGVDDDEVEMGASLTSDLGAESIDFLDIKFRVEKAFDIKIGQDELFPENVLQNEEYVKDGKVTDKGLEELKSKLPHVDLTSLESDPDVNNVGKVVTVEALVKFTETKLAG
jgi:acyl carrier protein